MPAGNDIETHKAFRSAMESQYGEYQNAEELIRGHAASIDPAVRRASLTQVNVEQTDEANEDLEATAGRFKGIDKGWTLLSAAVRGNALVGVFTDEQGDYRKVVTGANDRYTEPELTEGELALRAQHEHATAVSAAAARLRAEADAVIAEVEAEQSERIAKAIAKIRAKADDDLAEALEEADKPKAEKPKAEKPKAPDEKKPADKKPADKKPSEAKKG